jgi:hypothetical protein
VEGTDEDIATSARVHRQLRSGRFFLYLHYGFHQHVYDYRSTEHLPDGKLSIHFSDRLVGRPGEADEVAPPENNLVGLTTGGFEHGMRARAILWECTRSLVIAFLQAAPGHPADAPPEHRHPPTVSTWSASRSPGADGHCWFPILAAAR